MREGEKEPRVGLKPNDFVHGDLWRHKDKDAILETLPVSLSLSLVSHCIRDGVCLCYVCLPLNMTQMHGMVVVVQGKREL